MASGTLEETKSEEGASSEEKERSEGEEKDTGGSEVEEKEEPKEEESSEGEKEVKDEGAKKGERVRKRGSAKKGGNQLKKSGEESTEKKSRKRNLSPKEPITPIERPSRERKTVERYSASSSERPSTPKGVSIEKVSRFGSMGFIGLQGRGTQLKDIPNVAFKMSKRKPDENLHMLHTILFGKKGKTHSLKRNINQFSGFVWVENEEKQRAKIKEKLDKCVKEKLLDFCDLLDIPVSKSSIRKEELLAKLLEFLESPHATTEVSLADKEQLHKGTKRKRTTFVTPETTSGEASAKKRKRSSVVKEKRKRSSKIEENVEEEVEYAYPRGDSDEADDNGGVREEESDEGVGESEDEEEKAKEQMESKKGSDRKTKKKGSEAKTRVEKGGPTSAKSSMKSLSGSTSKKASATDGKVSGSVSKSKGLASKKKSQKSRTPSSSKDKKSGKKRASNSGAKLSIKERGKGKEVTTKPKLEPSKEEMHAAVSDILREVDFNTATLSDIIRQLGSHFGMDLMHKKSEVKNIIEEVIRSMTDEEDDSEENTEADGDDVEEEEDDEDGDA